MADLRWWLLHLSADGKVLSCTPVDQAARNGESWLYVQAVDKAHAQRLALNEYQRELMRRRVARLRAEGKCQCGRKNDREPLSRCSTCAGRRKEDNARRNARAKGHDIPRPDRRIADAARKQAETAEAIAAAAPSQRLAVLQEVHGAWCRSTTSATFTAWLLAEIERAGGKRRAANG